MACPSAPLDIRIHPLGTAVLVEIEGELDLLTGGHVAATFHRLLADRPTAIEVDAADLTFVDARGLRALLVARRATHAAGIRFHLVQRSAALDRLLGMTGLSELLGGETD